MAVAMVAVMGSVGLAVDWATWSTEDQDAIGGGRGGDCRGVGAGGRFVSDHAPRRSEDSSLNGYTNGIGNTTVTVNNPPRSGPNSG